MSNRDKRVAKLVRRGRIRMAREANHKKNLATNLLKKVDALVK